METAVTPFQIGDVCTLCDAGSADGFVVTIIGPLHFVQAQNKWGFTIRFNAPELVNDRRTFYAQPHNLRYDSEWSGAEPQRPSLPRRTPPVRDMNETPLERTARLNREIWEKFYPDPPQGSWGKAAATRCIDADDEDGEEDWRPDFLRRIQVPERLQQYDSFDLPSSMVRLRNEIRCADETTDDYEGMWAWPDEEPRPDKQVTDGLLRAWHTRGIW